MSDTDKLDRLAELAQLATQGPYIAHDSNESDYLSWVTAYVPADGGHRQVAACQALSAAQVQIDARYIAACDPRTILDLLRVVRAAREIACNEAEDIDDRLRYVMVQPGRDEWCDLLDALKALAVVEKEADDA